MTHKAKEDRYSDSLVRYVYTPWKIVYLFGRPTVDYPGPRSGSFPVSTTFRSVRFLIRTHRIVFSKNQTKIKINLYITCLSQMRRFSPLFRISGLKSYNKVDRRN